MRDPDLLDIVIHDIGNQLTVMNGFAEMLAVGFDELPPEMLQEFSQAILRSGQDMRALLESVADLRRLDEGRLALRTEPVDLVALVRGVVDRNRPDLGPRGIELVLPDALVTAVDRVRIERIVGSLVSSVSRHTPRDATVTIELGVVGDVVELSVTDDGPGVPPERAAALFDRAASPRSGLHLSREVARGHGGDLVLVDRPRGACFLLRLPSLPG